MAVITDVHSAAIEAANSSPPTLVSPGTFGGVIHRQTQRVAIVDNESIGSIKRFFRVKSTDTVLSIRYLTSETLTALAADVGLYRTEMDGGAVVDADAYASAVSLATASIGEGVSIGHEARGVDVIGQPVWDDIASQTTDTKLEYDIAITITTAVTDPGTLTLILDYIPNG